MSFEDFLKKESRYPENRHPENSMCISVQALGEWAWKFILEDIKQIDMPNQAKKEGWVFDFPNVDAYYAQEMALNQIALHWEIAVACLGEKEIKKRLKFLQEENVNG